CAGALALAGCATTGEYDETAHTCKPEPGQQFVGQRATAELGAAILRATRAGQLRWAPPRSALTMDFRMDRVTVTYDDAMAITMVTCG
ncbi:MAG TPA: I78 family peptidase inhibitor, partial [Croceibacterium sp.]|nr:I78 family peptidase inhibitor [Croceibacterium sp.]